MKFCCTLGFVHTDYLVELAVVAEESGWDVVTLADHVVNPDVISARYPYSKDGARGWGHQDPWPDVWVATATMAAHTTRLRFSQGVYILPMREPFSVAKALGTCARMSGHRVSLGVGLGWLYDEFEILGQEFKDRGPRTDEMIEVIRKLLSGELVEHHGRFYDFDPLSMSPGAGGEIPIIIGGQSKPALRRVARLGDGWAPAYLPVAEIATAIAEIRSMRAGTEREGASLEVFAACPDANDIDGYRRMEDAEISHLVSKPWRLYSETNAVGIASVAEMKDGLRRFGDEVIARMR
jgi:probable F420-dependent oxidoreductase